MSHPQIAVADIDPGFIDPVHDAQRVFRALLEAMSRPGTPVTIEVPGGLPKVRAPIAPAAFASLLALCDDSTPVFLAAADPILAAALRFHTGASLAAEPDGASFAYMHDAGALPSLDSFACGTPEQPERAATLFVRVDAFTGGLPRVLSGPGIRGATKIAPVGLPARFWAEREKLAEGFPCGIDCCLVCGVRLLGLPRATLAEVG